MNKKAQETPTFLNGKRACIYLITNLVTGKRYVGQTTMSLSDRWRHHARTRNEFGDGIGDEIGRYGASSFSVLELAVTYELDKLDELEQFYILQYRTLAPNGYNLTVGGKTFSKSSQHRDRLAFSKIGLRFTETPKGMPQPQGTRMLGVGVKPVIGTHLVTGEIVELPGVSLDPRFDGRLISACCYGKRRHHRGYSWRFKHGS